MYLSTTGPVYTLRPIEDVSCIIRPTIPGIYSLHAEIFRADRRTWIRSRPVYLTVYPQQASKASIDTTLLNHDASVCNKNLIDERPISYKLWHNAPETRTHNESALYTSMPIGSSSNMEILAYRIAKYDEKNGVFRVTASEIEASATFALDKSRISQLNDCTEIRFKPKVPGVYRVYVASRPIEAKTGKMAASTQPLLLIVRPESSK